jgi:signal transduction histidine kinase
VIGPEYAQPDVRGGLAFRAVAASVVFALIVGAVFAVLLNRVEHLRDAARQAVDTRDELAAADRLQKAIVDIETGQRGFVITGKERFLDPWRAGREAFPPRAERLIELADTPAGKARARRIAEAGKAYIREYSIPLVQAARRGDPSARSVAATQEGKDRVDDLRSQFARLISADRETLTRRQETADDDAQRAITIATIGLVGSVVLMLLGGAYGIRALVLPIRRTSSMAGRLAEGDFGVRLPEGGPGEIGALERSFNTMADSLEASRSELVASRARVVAAGDESRRRIERDLHDGAQQRLVHAVIVLKLARRAIGEDDGEPAKLVDEALDHAERANAELRELAHGILPGVLRRGGLRAGVEALASRLPLPVSVNVTPERLPESVEATAYFITAEALTNVVKHAQARLAAVVASVDGGVLHLEVRDDGVGGAKVEGSSGLLGLQDRASAVGGELDVESLPGSGTVVVAKLPVPQPARDGTGSTASE